MNAVKRGARLVGFQPLAEMLAFLADAGDEFVARAAHQVAGDLQRLRRLGRDLAGGRQHRRFQRVFLDHVVDQPGRLGALGRKALAEAEQREGALAAEDLRREQAGPRLRHQAEIDEGRAGRRCAAWRRSGRNAG